MKEPAVIDFLFNKVPLLFAIFISIKLSYITFFLYVNSPWHFYI